MPRRSTPEYDPAATLKCDHPITIARSAGASAWLTLPSSSKEILRIVSLAAPWFHPNRLRAA